MTTPHLENLDPVTALHVSKAAASLEDELKGNFSTETIERFISDSLDKLSGSSVTVFVPVLAHRFARERLRPWPKRRT